MKGNHFNNLLELNASHCLYRKDGKWYHHLKRFPSILFDENGYVYFASEKEYLDQKELSHSPGALHVPMGISKIPHYHTFTENEKKLIQGVPDNERVAKAASKIRLTALWGMVMAYMPLQTWVPLSQIIDIVREKLSGSYRVSTLETDGTSWEKKLKSVLDRKSELGEIEHDGNAYRMNRPVVWRMIREATNHGHTAYKDIQRYINGRWYNVNPNTITAQIIVLTVNHTSRVDYPENKKPRKTDSCSPYDYLYWTKRGNVVKYDPAIHGIWEIYESNTKPGIRQIDKKTFSPADIKWIKSVSNTHYREAYMNLDSDVFILNFPNKFEANGENPAVGDIILIYQKLRDQNVFTHLVTPIEGNVIEENERGTYRFGRRVRIIAKTDYEDAIPSKTPLIGKGSLSGIGHGNVIPIPSMKSVEDLDAIQWDIWERFKEFFYPDGQSSLATVADLLDDLEIAPNQMTANEGGLRLVTHRVRERDRKIVTAKKKQALNEGKLFCEVCTFSFLDFYEKEFIECHHRMPIAQAGEGQVELKDFALVCPNCHRMLHTKFDGKYLTTDELKDKFHSG